MKCPVVSFEVSGFSITLGTLFFNVQGFFFLFCWRISMVCLALELTGSWVELGFHVGMEAFG